jgi:hypothetical protein
VIDEVTVDDAELYFVGFGRADLDVNALKGFLAEDLVEK